MGAPLAWSTVGTLGIVGLSISSSCAAEPDEPPPIRDPQALVSADAWRVIAPADDLFAERIVPNGVCEAGEGHYREDFASAPAYKIDTTFCDGVTIGQPLLTDIRTDEVIDFKVFHFALVADTPAEAMLALAIDGEHLWEERVPIPLEAGLIEVLIEPPRDLPAGAPLQFHIDNHGDNNWVLFRVERQPG